MENNTNPFTPDSSIPEISPGGSESRFTFPDSDHDTPAPIKNSFPWKWIGIIVGIVLIVTLIGVGLAFILPAVTNSPERAVHSFYDALQARDIVRMQKCLDPDDPISLNAASMLLPIEQYIDQYIAQLGLQIGINWELQNLTYTLVENQNDYAKVEVTGRLRLYETITNLSISLPYDVTHELVRKNGQWYISTNGQLSTQ
jgi:hypothetical protein